MYNTILKIQEKLKNKLCDVIDLMDEVADNTYEIEFSKGRDKASEYFKKCEDKICEDYPLYGSYLKASLLTTQYQYGCFDTSFKKECEAFIRDNNNILVDD